MGLDPKVAQYYSDSIDLGIVNADGSRWDLQAFKKACLDLPNSVTSIKWITTCQDFTFLTKDIVICAWDGKDETVMKSGDEITYDPHAYTMIFKGYVALN